MGRRGAVGAAGMKIQLKPSGKSGPQQLLKEENCNLTAHTSYSIRTENSKEMCVRRTGVCTGVCVCQPK